MKQTYKTLEKALDKAWLRAYKSNDTKMLGAIEAFNDTINAEVEN